MGDALGRVAPEGRHVLVRRRSEYRAHCPRNRERSTRRCVAARWPCGPAVLSRQLRCQRGVVCCTRAGRACDSPGTVRKHRVLQRAYTGRAPTCVLRHQLSSERRIVLLLQPLHERQALSIRVRGCGQPARRRRTSCAHAARLRRPSCAPCWQWTNVTFVVRAILQGLGSAPDRWQSERQHGVITIQRSSES